MLNTKESGKSPAEVLAGWSFTLPARLTDLIVYLCERVRGTAKNVYGRASSQVELHTHFISFTNAPNAIGFGSVQLSAPGPGRKPRTYINMQFHAIQHDPFGLAALARCSTRNVPTAILHLHFCPGRANAIMAAVGCVVKTRNSCYVCIFN